MKIHVGSRNPVKVEAVREVLYDYPEFKNCEVYGIGTHSGVSPQPRSMDETVEGARYRAQAVFNGGDYSFGIESGLMEVSRTKSGCMEFSACSIYDGSDYHLGFSCAFEFPPVITKLIQESGLDANEAFFQTGLSQDPQLGYSEGAIGFLTNGRIQRKELVKQAVQTALIHIEYKELY